MYVAYRQIDFLLNKSLLEKKASSRVIVPKIYSFSVIYGLKVP